MKQTTVFRGEKQDYDKHQKSPIEEGHEEGIKELAKEHEKNQKKLEELLDKTHNCLYQIKTVFPLDLFPSTLTVDANKIDLIDRYFFASDVRSSIPVQDVKSVSIESNMFFSTLKVIIDMPQDNSIIVGPLKKREALRMKRIIQGLNVCAKEEVNVLDISSNELLSKAEELGRTREN